MLFLMIMYQPGSRKEREVILQQIGSPEAGWNEESALTNLRLWKRRIARAKELEVIIPDPTVLMSALDLITAKALLKDPNRRFRIQSARQELKVDIQTTYEGVEKLMTILEGELDDMVSQTWTTVTPKLKSIKGTPKGKVGKGKDGKGDGKGKAGKGKDGKGKDPCYHFTETEEGCKHGQHCWKYHRMLKPDEKRCYVCGSQKHMAGECDRPKKEDPPPKEKVHQKETRVTKVERESRQKDKMPKMEKESHRSTKSKQRQMQKMKENFRSMIQMLQNQRMNLESSWKNSKRQS
jgi:hypothetical protein